MVKIRNVAGALLIAATAAIAAAPAVVTMPGVAITASATHGAKPAHLYEG